MSKDKIERVALTVRIPLAILNELEAQYGDILTTKNAQLCWVLRSWFQEVLEKKNTAVSYGVE